MKRKSLALIFVCCALALAAQDVIKVNYRGATPTIIDFTRAFANFIDNEDDCGDKPTGGVLLALNNYRKGLPQEEGVTIEVDKKNGYILYEFRLGNTIVRREACFWNEADGKHKLFAFNNMASISDGQPYISETSGITFCRYNNATKKMRFCKNPDFEMDYINTTYALPRIGKDIIVTKWNEDGTKTEKTLKWNGHGFDPTD